MFNLGLLFSIEQAGDGAKEDNVRFLLKFQAFGASLEASPQLYCVYGSAFCHDRIRSYGSKTKTKKCYRCAGTEPCAQVQVLY